MFTGQPAMTLKIDKNKVTRKWANSADEDFYGAITQVAAGWDLVNDDGTAFPLTSESLLSLGLTLQHEMELVEQIVNAAAPSRAEGNDLSRQRSTPSTDSVPPVETPQNGPATLPSPAVSESPSPT